MAEAIHDFTIPRSVLTEKHHKAMFLDAYPFKGTDIKFIYVNGHFIMFMSQTRNDIDTFCAMFPIPERLYRYLYMSSTIEKRNIFVDSCKNRDDLFCGKIYIDFDINYKTVTPADMKTIFLFFDKYSAKIKALANTVGKPYFVEEHNIHDKKPIKDEELTEAGKRLRKFFIEFDAEKEEVRLNLSRK